MLENFIKIAWRSLIRQRFYSIINIAGLSSGLVCALFIYLWVTDEVQKDKFHENADSIYRIISNLDLGDGKITTWAITPGPLEQDIRDNTPEVELIARTNDTGPQLFHYEDQDFMERGIYADPQFFRIFSFKIEAGAVPQTLDKKWIAISHDLARKLFGAGDPLGKSVNVNKSIDVMVAAVFENPNTRSSLKFDFVLPFEITKENRGDGFNWNNFDYPLYVKLADGASPDKVIASVNARAAKLKEIEGIKFYIQPFADSYLNSNFENGVPSGGRVKYVRIFTVVALFIVIIACINFMNMATARATTRTKEVGVRKVVGAQRKSLIAQFIGESVVVSLFAMVLAGSVVYLGLPLFNLLVEKNIVLDVLSAKFILSSLAIAVVTGLLAGSYPAFFLSSFHTATILKGGVGSSFGGASLRKVLVVFQFSLTVIMVACALIVYQQMEYIRGKDIGYNRESVITFSARGSIRNSFDAFRQDALQLNGIKNISRSNETLVQVNNQNGSVSWPGKPADSQQLFRTVVVDYGFLETMELKLLQGRLFSREFSDTSNFVLTRRAVEAMGLREPLGQTITQWGTRGVVVGVVDDFHSRSVHEAIDPIVFMCNPQWTGKIFVRFDGQKLHDVVGELEELSHKYAPEYPFEYTFMDDDFEKLYSNEKVTSALALGFTAMAIIISCLGLLGLASYTTERRRKEISIRKTLGASVASIIAGMSKDFAWLSLLAALLGCPVAYYFMSGFLEGYVYHVQLGWGLFVLTAVGVLVISLVTIAFQVTKAAFANPVDALRNE